MVTRGKRRKNDFRKLDRLFRSIWINLFFLFFVNWNEDLRNGDISFTNGVSLIWNTTTIIIVELRNELKKLNIDLSMIYKLIFPLVNNIIKLSS